MQTAEKAQKLLPLKYLTLGQNNYFTDAMALN